MHYSAEHPEADVPYHAFCWMCEEWIENPLLPQHIETEHYSKASQPFIGNLCTEISQWLTYVEWCEENGREP